MRPEAYRNVIIAAVEGRAEFPQQTEMLDNIVTALIQAEQAKEVLRHKGYGQTGTPIAAMARMVPAVRGA